MMEDLFGSSAAAVPLNDDDDDDFAAATTISSCNNHHHHDNYNSVDEDLLRFQDCYSHGSSNAKTTTAAAAVAASDHPFQCNPMLQFKNKTITGSANGDDHSNEFLIINAQITNHPRFPNLVSAHIECQKVGAPPKMAALLEEIGFESNFTKTSTYSCSSDIGADQELDEFMESYCEVLHRYKEELSRPFDEATSFFTTMQAQLSDICKGEFSTILNDYFSDEKVGTSEEELSCCGREAGPPESQGSVTGGDGEGNVKEELMRKYRGCVSSLKKELLKKRKKGKLPIDAKPTLMNWWHQHHTWPYPTEDEKLKLSEETGLEQKQINNWFINQRKRHWKPCEDMRFALLGLELGCKRKATHES